MSERAELLRQARASHAAVWLDFQRSYAKRPTDLFCLFEGQDDVKYFGVRIDLILYGVQRHALICDGKENALRVFYLIKQDTKYVSARLALFVDADFDDNTPLAKHSECYITPCYSIENLYVSTDSFLRVLKEEFFIDESNEADYRTALDLHARCMTSFCDATELLNLWIFEQRSRETGGKRKLNLRDFQLETIMSTSANGSVANYDLGKLSTIFPHADKITAPDIEKHRKLITESERTRKFRGKFMLYAYQVFLRYLIRDINSKAPKVFSARKKVKLTLQDGNVISQLSQYADTPPCLIAFLQALAHKYRTASKVTPQEGAMSAPV